MYFGSVRFFKHMILFTVALLILIPTSLSIYWGITCARLKAEISELTPSKSGEQLPVKGFDPLPMGLPGQVYAAENDESATFSYQTKYPDLYVDNDFTHIVREQKTVYLTFDDGPSTLTPQFLDLLAKYEVKGTFFVIYKDDQASQDIYKRIVDEGHTLAVHTATHDYQKIYQSVDAYLDDFARITQMLKTVTGESPELFRFPGGSINNYNRSIYQPLIAEMSRRGYTYYDWNVSSADTSPKKTVERICQNVISGVHGQHESVVLMHDAASHNSTLTALSTIIETLKSEGYTFAPLDKTVTPTTFGYPN